MMNMKKIFKGSVALVVALMMMMSCSFAEQIETVETAAPVVEAAAPATEAPATEAPATEAPATEAPATEAPATEAPATEAPATEAPATEAPATEAPATEAPATEAPATEIVEAAGEPESTEIFAGEAVETGLPTGTVEIVSEKRNYSIGDTVTMTAIVTGFEGCAYELQWQFSDNGGNDWLAAAGSNNGTNYSFEMTEQNATWCWRVAVIL